MKMLIRNGIKQNLRAKGKTILFFILIMVLTIMMIFSVGINTYCDLTIEKANESYRTIAILEYMGSEYPSRTYADSYARNAFGEINQDEITKIDGVKSVTPSSMDSMYLDGYVRKSNELLYKDYGILILTHFTKNYAIEKIEVSKNEKGAKYDRYSDTYYIEEEYFVGYRAVIEDSIYSYEGKSKIAINLIVDSNIDLNLTDRYICHGYFTSDGINNGLKTFIVSDFLDDESSPIVKLNDDNTYLIDDSIFTIYAEKYRCCNNYVSVVNSKNLEDVYEFQQGNLYLKEGRFPNEDEENVCVISMDIKEKLGLNLGDEISLTMLNQDYNNMFDLTKTDIVEKLIIVGITNDNTNYTGYIYRIKNVSSPILYGYTLYTISLENEKAYNALLEIEKNLPENVRITLYDQGFSSFYSSINTIKEVTRIISYVTGIGVVIVLLLFSIIFIGREKENIKTLILFGTPKKKINLWILSGSLMVSISSSILSGIISIFLLPHVINLIAKVTELLNDTSLLYSETVLGNTIEMDLDVNIPMSISILIVLSIITLIVIFLIIFLNITYKEALPKMGVSKVKEVNRNIKVKCIGPLKFALNSIIRGSMRSIIVPITAFILTIIIVFLSSIYQGYSNSLNEAYKDINIEGQVTSLYGDTYYNLGITIPNYKKISELEFIDEPYVSGRFDYYLEGTIPYFGEGSFSQEHKKTWIESQPEIVFTNNLKGAKEFYYVEPNVTYLDGFDENILLDTYPTVYEVYYGYSNKTTYPIIVNNSFIEKYGYKLGDEIILYLTTDEMDVSCKIVGIYKGVSDTMYIYGPLSMYIPLSFLNDVSYDNEKLFYESYDSGKESLYKLMYNELCFSTFRFSIKSGYDIGEVRNILYEEGYSSPGSIQDVRTTIILRDSKIVELKNTLGRYVGLGKIILCFILIIVSIISFVLSWLMINGRKKEFLIMRGFGVTKKEIFLSFFLEQFILFMIGFILGLISLLFIKSYGMIEILSIVGLILSYSLGALVEINILNKINLMNLVSSGDL